MIFGNVATVNRYGYILTVLTALGSATSKTLMETCTYLALSLAIFSYFRFKTVLNLDNLPKKGLVVFFGTLLISSIFSLDSRKSFYEVFVFFKAVLPLFLPYLFIKDRYQLSVIVMCLAVSIVVPSLYAVHQGINGNYRAAAFFGNPVAFAGFLAVYIPLLYTLGIEKFFNGQRNLLLLCALILTCTALVFSGTRGVWIGVVATFFMLVVTKVRDSKKTGILLLALFIASIAILMSFSQVNNRVKTITDMNYTSNTERVLMWKSAMAMARDYPIFGVGLGNFKEMEKEIYMSPLAKEPSAHMHAHNTFLHLLAETGLVGIAGFTTLFASVFWTIFKGKNDTDKTMMMVAFFITCSLLIHGLTEHNFGHHGIMRAYWFTLGTVLVGHRILNQKILK